MMIHEDIVHIIPLEGRPLTPAVATSSLVLVDHIRTVICEFSSFTSLSSSPLHLPLTFSLCPSLPTLNWSLIKN